MDFGKFDKIMMTEDEMWLLFEWKENHKDYVRAFKPVLTKGLIVVGDMHKQTFEDLGDKWLYNTYINDNLLHSLYWEKETKMGYIIQSFLHQDMDREEYNSSVITLHATLMAYMEYYSDKKEYVERKELKSMIQRKSNKKSKNKKAPTRIKRVVYTVKVDKESVKVDRKRYERLVDKWTVRGHWREMKSGKKVWIKPYVKGEGKEVTPKEYKL